jgi:acyl-CoA thioester hydrolase
MPYVCESRFRVRYAETDQMGMVYYANYLIWMEVGRSDFCRQCGFSYSDLEREEKAYLAVAEALCRYRAPARYDDEILVETEMTRVGSRILEFSYRIKNAATLLAEGRTLHVVVGPDGKQRSMPQRYLELLKSRQD